LCLDGGERPAGAAAPGAVRGPDPRGGGAGDAAVDLGRHPGGRSHSRTPNGDRGGPDQSLPGGGRDRGQSERGHPRMTTVQNPEAAAFEARLRERERQLEALRRELLAWRARYDHMPLRDDAEFTSVSGRQVEPVYTPLDLADSLRDPAGLPGLYPYPRGLHHSM